MDLQLFADRRDLVEWIKLNREELAALLEREKRESAELFDPSRGPALVKEIKEQAKVSVEELYAWTEKEMTRQVRWVLQNYEPYPSGIGRPARDSEPNVKE